MPVVSYVQNGGGQLPLWRFLPSLSSRSPISSAVLPPYPPVAVFPSTTPVENPNAAPDGADEHLPPTVDISIEHPSYRQSTGPVPTPSLALAGGLTNESDMGRIEAAASATITFFGLLAFSQIWQHMLFQRLLDPIAQAEEPSWVGSSHSWLDRNTCNWIGFCGMSHLAMDKLGLIKLLFTREKNYEKQKISGTASKGRTIDLSEFWRSAQEDKELPRSGLGLEDCEIPSYVIKHAPLIHLYSGEEYWPCDMAEHLIHTTPHLNYTSLQAKDDHPNLDNLNDLNEWGPSVYLQSDDNVEDRPEWLVGESNIPHEGKSDAPAVLIVVPKDNGVVDAFWFFFYSFNRGNAVLNVPFGHHVGDWEHTVVRFQDGVPQAVFFSQHSFGEAYTWEAVEKSGKRPIGFSATGTHAMYATSGFHPYSLPGGLLHDVTDRGPLWDPTLNLYSFTYDYQKKILRSSDLTPEAPTGWFYFMGHWGDKLYPLGDPRQYRFLGFFHYVSGPLGPSFKNLGRKQVCPGDRECSLKNSTSVYVN